MLMRIVRYLNKMFPPWVNIPVGIVSFFSCYWLALEINGIFSLSLSFPLIRGAVSIPLFMLLLRVMDELKDYKTDMVLPDMKDRPLVTGLVTKKDLHFLIIFITLCLLLLNLFNGPAVVIAFLVLLVYCYLMCVYFFYPKMPENLFLALVTHNPVVILFQFYILSFILTHPGIQHISPFTFLLPLLFWLPFLGWEIGRKIRAPSEETEYVTYSRLLGYKKPVIILVLFVIMVLSLALFFIFYTKLHISFGVLIILLCLFVIARLVWFLKKPFSVKSGFKREFEILITGINAGFFIFLLYKGIAGG